MNILEDYYFDDSRRRIIPRFPISNSNHFFINVFHFYHIYIYRKFSARNNTDLIWVHIISFSAYNPSN